MKNNRHFIEEADAGWTRLAMKDLVHVFKTNIDDPGNAALIKTFLSNQFPGIQCSFDLGDCDKILRVEHSGVPAIEIIKQVRRRGFHCEELKD